MKRALSFVLALVLLVGLMPMQAFATDGTQEPEVIETITEPKEEVAVVHEHEYATEVKDATCTEQGYTTYTCACGDSYVGDYVDVSGHSFQNGICVDCNRSAMELDYTHAIPQSQGVVNAIARAYQLTDVEWTPVADMPGIQKIDGNFTVITFEAGVTYRGIPYSGVTATDTYVGLNVSLESFLTAVRNKNSVLYTENLFSTNPKSATYFGTVCSKFAQYVLDIPGSYNTNNVANIPGVDTIALPGQYTVDQIKLGDIVLHTQDHTTICTDILYDADGNVAFVEISEAVLPLVRRKLWSPEEFYSHFSGYRLCRYQYINDVPAVPDALPSDREYALMPRFGDKYNYKVSSTKGIVDILESGYSTAVVIRDGKVIDRIIVDSTTKTFKFDCSVPGHIEMYLEKADGTRSGSVYANVVKSSVSVNDSSEFARGKLTVTIDGSCGAPLYVQVGSAHAIFCNVEGREGTVEITFPASKISTRQVRVAYQNEYGIYLSNWVSFTADENPSKDPLLSQGQYWNGYNITPSSPNPVVQEDKAGYWSYTMIPVEENTTYYSWGATRMWYLDANGQTISTYNAYKDSAVPCQFTTPEGTAYVSIAYSPILLNQGEEKLEKLSADLEDGNDEEEIVPSNPSTDPYLSQGEYWDGYTLTPTNSTPSVQAGKENYWTYTMIPVEGNTTYYSEGANRMWFFDANKKPISTYNAISDSTIRFQFTTPENARYVSITYAPSVVEKGTETMKKVGPVITQQPESVQQEVGKKFAITVKAEGEGLSYQWYVKEAGAKAFKVSSNKTASYAYTMQTYMHNRQVYCVITDQYGNQVTTETATITRSALPVKITQQPADVSVAMGDTFSVTVKTEGDDLTYQWYYKNAGGKSFAASSIKKSSYSSKMVSYMVGRQVYCVVTDKYGNQVTSDVATIKLPAKELKILTQPEDVHAPLGQKFSVAPEVQGEGLTYQWYYKNAGGKSFSASSNKTAAYAYSMQSYMNGRQVYCVITDQFGNQVTTDIVTIHATK